MEINLLKYLIVAFFFNEICVCYVDPYSSNMPEMKDIVEKAWDFKEVDWNDYESHRPPYTKALYEILFQYHEAHNGQYDAALDVGAGGGTVTLTLLKKFNHVFWSDQSEDYLMKAQQRFSKEVDAGSISFLKRKFDEFEPEQDLSGEKVDMITAGTCLHFADPALIMSQLGSWLRSGGTVAAFSYGSTPIVDAKDPAGPIIKKCKDKIMRWIHENIISVDDSRGRGTGTSQARYNDVDFDPAIWKDVRRITSMPHESVWPDWIKPAASRVRDGESTEIVNDDFIIKEVDYDFFPKYFYNFAPPLPLLDKIQEELEELKVAMGNRKIICRWPALMILGTKR